MPFGAAIRFSFIHSFLTFISVLFFFSFCSLALLLLFVFIYFSTFFFFLSFDKSPLLTAFMSIVHTQFSCEFGSIRGRLGVVSHSPWIWLLLLSFHVTWKCVYMCVSALYWGAKKVTVNYSIVNNSNTHTHRDIEIDGFVVSHHKKMFAKKMKPKTLIR